MANILKPGGTPADASSGFAFESDSRLLENPNTNTMPTSQQEWQHFIVELNKWKKDKSGIFVPVFVGFSTDPLNPTVEWYRDNKTVTLYFNFLSNVSDRTDFKITNLPDEINPGRDVIVPCLGMLDAGSYVGADGVALVQGANKQIRFHKDHSLTNNWTASGQKGMDVVGFVITYPILAPEKL